MLFQQRKLIGIFPLLLCGISITNAYLPQLPVNSVAHKSRFSHEGVLRNLETKEAFVNFRHVETPNRIVTTKISAATTDDDSGSIEGQATLLGTLVLLTVPLSWGTYVPVGE